jgi:hypothetical protein
VVLVLAAQSSIIEWRGAWTRALNPMIEFNCRECKASIQRSESDAGSKILCPDCYVILIVPGPTDQAITATMNIPSSAATTAVDPSGSRSGKLSAREMADDTLPDIEKPPKHYTKLSFLTVPLCGLIGASIPLLCFWSFRLRTNLGLFEGMIAFGVLGVAASIPLVARSHIRSETWSNVVLFTGILIIGVALSIGIAVLMK